MDMQSRMGEVQTITVISALHNRLVCSAQEDLLDHDMEYPNTQTRPFLSEQVKEYHQRFSRHSKGRKWTVIKIRKFSIVLA